jgi:hypothetical protein
MGAEEENGESRCSKRGNGANLCLLPLVFKTADVHQANVIFDWIFKVLAPEFFCYLPAKITGFRVL